MSTGTQERGGKTRGSVSPEVPPVAGATEYADFVIEARRTNPRSVQVRVLASPAGKPMRKAVLVRFPAEEGRQLRDSFRSGPGSAGRMEITQDEAAEIGRRLSAVLFPGPVFGLLGESLGQITRRPEAGLRLRLVLDASLVDLPWEYVRRPDRRQGAGLSGFLLLDARISLVREAAHPGIELTPITGRQRLAFVGALWEGQKDGWEVRKEFAQICAALKSVSRFIAPAFATATQHDAFAADEEGEAAIFHYAGHCDMDGQARAFLVRELPATGALEPERQAYIEDLALGLGGARTRLVVLSACNSGFWPAVGPLLEAGVPSVLGVNGAVASQSTIVFCAKLYESLAVGLSLDEAVGRARLHVMEWGQGVGLFDWGLYMVYMRSPQAVLFPRAESAAVTIRQRSVRSEHESAIGSTWRRARDLDGMNFGEMMSECSKRRVLILGRFTGRRLKVLEAMKERLAKHPNGYIPELFTFKRPDARDLVESIKGFAAFSRFIIADLSEPRSIQSELEAIVPHFMSVPVAPVINRTGREYATFPSIQRRENVLKPTLRYRDLDDLLKKLDQEVVPRAEAKLATVRPAPRLYATQRPDVIAAGSVAVEAS